MNSHEKFVNGLRKYAFRTFKEDFVNLLFVTRKYIIYPLLRIITIDLSGFSKMKEDIELIDGFSYILHNLIKQLIADLRVILRYNPSSYSKLFFKKMFADPVAQAVLDKKFIPNPNSDVQMDVRKYQIQICRRYAQAQEPFKKLILEAIKTNNTELMEDLYIRLSILNRTLLPNVFSPEIDILEEKINNAISM